MPDPAIPFDEWTVAGVLEVAEQFDPSAAVVGTRGAPAARSVYLPDGMSGAFSSARGFFWLGAVQAGAGRMPPTAMSVRHLCEILAQAAPGALVALLNRVDLIPVVNVSSGPEGKMLLLELGAASYDMSAEEVRSAASHKCPSCEKRLETGNVIVTPQEKQGQWICVSCLRDFDLTPASWSIYISLADRSKGRVRNMDKAARQQIKRGVAYLRRHGIPVTVKSLDSKIMGSDLETKGGPDG